MVVLNEYLLYKNFRRMDKQYRLFSPNLFYYFIYNDIL
jgi:hypothetical protein